MDFDRYDNKFQKEQKKRQEEAKRKRDQEVKLQREHEARQKELTMLAEKRREEEEARRIQLELEEAEENRITGGINCKHVLTPYSIDADHETADDKVILPELCLTQLSNQDVFGKNVVIFRLSGSNGSITHGGVREFSAPEGHIGLPKKVLDCLGGDITQLSSVELKYILLPKCTYVKLRPKMNRFFEVQPVKRCLEENLLQHTTLTVGDTITVWYRGVAHPMIVVEMKPEQAGSLKDTDIEVDLDLSEEFQQKNIPSSVSTSSVNIADQSTTAVSASSVETVTPAYTLGRSNAALPLVRQLSQSLLSRFTLDAEPDATADASTYLAAKIRLPNGKAVVRKFSHSAQLIQIFLFLQRELGLDDNAAMNLQLSRRIEPRTWTVSDSTSLQSLTEVGLAVKSEALIATLLT